MYGHKKLRQTSPLLDASLSTVTPAYRYQHKACTIKPRPVNIGGVISSTML